VLGRDASSVFPTEMKAAAAASGAMLAGLLGGGNKKFISETEVRLAGCLVFQTVCRVCDSSAMGARLKEPKEGSAANGAAALLWPVCKTPPHTQACPCPCHPVLLSFHCLTAPLPQLEEIKATRGLNAEDGTIAADKPLVEVRRCTCCLVCLCARTSSVFGMARRGMVWLCCYSAAGTGGSVAHVPAVHLPRCVCAHTCVLCLCLNSAVLQVLREAKEAKEVAFQDQWKTMKQVGRGGGGGFLVVLGGGWGGEAPQPHPILLMP
jgi:hypothetical protein